MTNLQRLIENLDVNYNDYQLKIQKPCIDFINEDEENAQTKKTLIRDAIKPQVTIAQNVIQAISTAYNDNCDQTKKIGDMEDHIKSWENQVHGACEQIIKTVEAKTHYHLIDKNRKYALFELELETGKKNQIRAHLAAHGFPIAGDIQHRAITNPFDRLCLHARTLEFYHPQTNEKMKFEVPEPVEWSAK